MRNDYSRLVVLNDLMQTYPKTKATVSCYCCLFGILFIDLHVACSQILKETKGLKKKNSELGHKEFFLQDLEPLSATDTMTQLNELVHF